MVFLCEGNTRSECLRLENPLNRTKNPHRWPLTTREKIDDVTRCLVVPDAKLKDMMERLNAAFDKGLAADTAASASVRMLPSYVRSVPNGTEEGDFLALDLGGTNFRVLLIRIHNRQAEMKSKIFRVPDLVMKGTGDGLFDHIAACMAQFMEEHGLKGSARCLPLGFTFSFPCKQEGLTRARLINWTKGFNATGVENEDVVDLLRSACQRRGDIDIDVVAILNDTTGTLMACAFLENSCQVGIIVGTGTNACYMEKLSRCCKLEGEMELNDDEMCVNTEWGAFGDHGEMQTIRTEFDDEVDQGSINPGRQLFEKMISGMYLGEVVRVVLARLAREGLLFGGDTAAISKKGAFPTKYISEIESELMEDDERTFSKTLQILEDMGIEGVSQLDCIHVATVCTMVSTRAAYLTAAGIATILNRMRKRYVTVGVDGSVFRFHPTFPKLLDEKIDQLIDGDLEYQLMLSEDGSGRGAALVAAVATRMKNERR
ncbi:unnamed protein product, partial [Mesorhabditis spiculigera]